MVYDTARQLAAEMKAGKEYKTYHDLKESVMLNDTTKNLLSEYHRLQLQAQAAAVQGRHDDECLEKLRKVGEVLQFDEKASAFLIAEYQVNRMLSDVYKILAEAIEIDLSAFEG